MRGSGGLRVTTETLRRYRAYLVRSLTQGNFRHLVLRTVAVSGILPLKQQYRLGGVVHRPAYAYGLLTAATEAKALGYEGITAIEFGVAGGNGLLALREHANSVTKLTGAAIAVVGFDTSTGLPAPVDYRDRTHEWAAGDYPMDEARLRDRLAGAELVIGDVRDTVSKFVDERSDALSVAPIGFVSFDLDYWSSTVAAFDLFRGDRCTTVCVPRVMCYFDDIPGTIEDVGELRAIGDFNQEPHGRRIRAQYGLRSYVPFQPPWAEQMFQCHLFDHPGYGRQPASFGTARLDLEDRWL